MHQYLEIAWHELNFNDWDEVLVIAGYNGKGKTHLGLHIADWWINKKYGEVKEEDAPKYIGMDLKQFGKVLSTANKKDLVMDDEAGDISSRGSMSRMNRLYMQAYQVIRGDNIFTILILPELWDLDPYFRKHRVRHFIHVMARGRLAFWSTNRYKRMVAFNSSMPFKNYYITQPTFYDTFPIYRGNLMPEYKKMKADKMKNVRIQLAKDIEASGASANEAKIARDEKIFKLREEGTSVKELAKKFGLSNVMIYNVCSQLKQAKAILEK